MNSINKCNLVAKLKILKSFSYLARVRATFNRRGSFRNPIPWCSFERTQDIIIKSFSRPWKASTLATSMSYNKKKGETEFIKDKIKKCASDKTNFNTKIKRRGAVHFYKYRVQWKYTFTIMYKVY